MVWIPVGCYLLTVLFMAGSLITDTLLAEAATVRPEDTKGKAWFFLVDVPIVVCFAVAAALFWPIIPFLKRER